MNKILIVDDTAHLLEEISDLLIMEGYNILTASNALDGLAIVEDFMPDLIITDLLMPKMDGFEFISELRAKPELEVTPIIVLSAQVTKETEQKIKEYSADAYLRKPCTADQLITAIDKLLK